MFEHAFLFAIVVSSNFALVAPACQWSWSFYSTCGETNHVGTGGDCLADIGGSGSCYANGATICNDPDLKHTGTCYEDCMRYHRNCCCPPIPIPISQPEDTEESVIVTEAPTTSPVNPSVIINPEEVASPTQSPLSSENKSCRWSWIWIDALSSCGDNNYVGNDGLCLADASGGSCYANGATICNDPALQHTGTCYEDCMRYHRNCCCPPGSPLNGPTVSTTNPSLSPIATSKAELIPTASSSTIPTNAPTSSPATAPASLSPSLPDQTNVASQEEASLPTSSPTTPKNICRWSWSFGSTCGLQNYVGENGDCLANLSGPFMTPATCWTNSVSVCDSKELQHTGTCYEDCLRYHRNCCCPPAYPPDPVDLEIGRPSEFPTVANSSSILSAPTNSSVSPAPTASPTDSSPLLISEEVVVPSDTPVLSPSNSAAISESTSCRWSWIWIDALSSCGDYNYVGDDGLCLADASGGSCYSNGATICNDPGLGHTGTCYEDCMRYHRNCCCPPGSVPGEINGTELTSSPTTKSTSNPTNLPTVAPASGPNSSVISEEQLTSSPTRSPVKVNPLCRWSWYFLDALSNCQQNYIGDDGLCLADTSVGFSCYAKSIQTCNDPALQHTGTCYEDCLRYHRNCCCPPDSPPDPEPSGSPSLSAAPSRGPSSTPTVGPSTNPSLSVVPTEPALPLEASNTSPTATARDSFETASPAYPNSTYNNSTISFPAENSANSTVYPNSTSTSTSTNSVIDTRTEINSATVAGESSSLRISCALCLWMAACTCMHLISNMLIE